jgi:tetrahydromethanopterin S-methyltransferase subunit G
MSTEQQSNEEDRNFEESIEEIYQQYRHRQLTSRLEDIAETMEETILQRILAEKFLQTELAIDEDAKRSVSEARDYLQDGDFEALSERIDELERKVDDQKRRVSNEIHEARIAMRSRVDGMKRLNERVERVSEVKLQAVHELLSDWDWKGQVYKNQDLDFEALKERAAEYGEDMRRYFTECREEIFGPYEGTTLESIVDGLLSDDQLYFDTLTDEQVEQLRESDLVDHVELTLS